jgi:hypothetical protein
MIELVSGMSAPQFGGGGEFVSVRIRDCSIFKQFLCFVLIVVRCFRLPRKTSSPILGDTRTLG